MSWRRWTAGVVLYALAAAGGCRLTSTDRAPEEPARAAARVPPPARPARDTAVREPAAPPDARRVIVTGVVLGRALGADKRVTLPDSTFAPMDTIYASVATKGASPSVNLAAKWTYQTGQKVDSTGRNIAPAGAAQTEFHVMKRSGFPPGRYRVEILLDGVRVGAREFHVRKRS
jgi:hypothetical protein